MKVAVYMDIFIAKEFLYISCQSNSVLGIFLFGFVLLLSLFMHRGNRGSC